MDVRTRLEADRWKCGSALSEDNCPGAVYIGTVNLRNRVQLEWNLFQTSSLSGSGHQSGQREWYRGMLTACRLLIY
ncbi:hypothetical protein K0T92_17215 [Paenibacillus oenotherae]|uniref:Uncharacterized protein n=1 Tax=Paenibacillus oenotherae TaxID=1435645 RepID=A0ABS7D9C1_9BACL|nr:hypothetical protein [Paenibacillus oenotherae]MBW7476476.1 hypothetical protein [Paenibacillus oenotherae]